MKTFFQLFHLSDLHFGHLYRSEKGRALPGLDTHSQVIANRLSESIRANKHLHKDTPSRVIVTGDLTTNGSEAEFDLVDQYLRKKLSIIREYSQPGLSAWNVITLPGNHDIWQARHNFLLRPGSGNYNPYDYPAFRAMFQDSVKERDSHFEGYPYRIDILPKHNPHHINIALYVLDSTRIDLYANDPNSVRARALRQLQSTIDTKLSQTQRQWLHALAAGFVDREQLINLGHRIKQEPANSIRIVAIHHPIAYPTPSHLNPDVLGETPWNEILTRMKMKMLANLSTVQEALRHYQVHFVLCGHQHKGFVREIFSDTESPINVLSVGSATQENNHYNEYRIYDFQHDYEGNVQIAVRVLRYGQFRGVYDFIEQPNPQIITL